MRWWFWTIWRRFVFLSLTLFQRAGIVFLCWENHLSIIYLWWWITSSKTGIAFTVFVAVWVSLLHQSGALKKTLSSHGNNNKNKSVLIKNFFNFFDDTPTTSAKTTADSSLHVFLWCLPLICTVVFGVYSLVYIVHSVIFFPTCPKAAETLKKDMKRTQNELVKLGVFTPKQMREMNKAQ